MGKGQSNDKAEANQKVDLSDQALFGDEKPESSQEEPKSEATPNASEAEPGAEEKEEKPQVKGLDEILAEAKKRFPTKSEDELLGEMLNSYRSMENEWQKVRMRESERQREPIPQPQAQAPTVEELEERFRGDFVDKPLVSSINLINTVVGKILDERLGPIENKNRELTLREQYADVSKQPYFEDVKGEMLSIINNLEATDRGYASYLIKRPNFMQMIYKEALANKFPTIISKIEEGKRATAQESEAEKIAAQVEGAGVSQPKAKRKSAEDLIGDGILKAAENRKQFFK